MLGQQSKFLVAILLISLVAIFPCSTIQIPDVQAAGNNIERVSISTNGTQGNFDSNMVSMSEDGRYVAFSSLANNLVPNDTNDNYDIFVRDRQTGATSRVSLSNNGTQANNGSANPSISGNGCYVAFGSIAYNLVSNDSNGLPDIFLRDRQSNTTTIISVSENGTQSNGLSLFCSISQNGRYIAFYSDASNLVPNDLNGCGDVFVRDLQTNTISLVSVSDNGTQSNGYSGHPTISGEGRYIAFESDASNLVANDTNGNMDVFVRDMQTLTTIRASASYSGGSGNGRSSLSSFVDTIGQCISADGRYIVFMSDSTNLLPEDMDIGGPNIFIRDQETNTTSLVSISPGGAQANGFSEDPAISLDGRYVAFKSAATNLVPGDMNNELDIFVRDCQKNTTAIASVSNDGAQGNGDSRNPYLGDGRYIALISDSSNLVPDDTNGRKDVFVARNPLCEELPPAVSPPSPTPTPTSASPHVSPALPPKLNQAQISLKYLSVNPQDARINQPLTISGNVVNTGDQAGNYSLSLKINGQVEQTRMVSVGPHASQPVKFTLTKSQPGAYTVDIGGQRETFTILGESPVKSSTSNSNLIILAAMGILALVAVILFISRRST